MTTNTLIIIITIIVSMLCFRNRDLFYRLSLNPYNITRRNQWERVLTHAFVHADYMHLFINMLVLWSFGRQMEMVAGMLGGARNYWFLALYIGGIIVSSIPDIIKYKDNPYYNSIGASGAASAVVFSSIFITPWKSILLFGVIPIPSIIFGALYIWYENYSSRHSNDNINHNAHIWGAIYGFIFFGLMEPGLFLSFFGKLLHPVF